MKEYAPGSASWAISNALRERYPDGVVEHGAWTQLGDEFGVTRELVRQVAVSLGIKRRNKIRMVRVCSSCGKCGVGKGGLFCSECVKIPLACDECGKIQYRYAADVVMRFSDAFNSKRVARGQGAYSGRYFCSHSCFGKRAGREHGWGNPEHPIHDKQRAAARA